jgi:XTP/dITP diphosphohydrolase
LKSSPTTLLYACSSNAGKLVEFTQVAGESASAPFRILPLPGIKQLKPPEESGSTFAENAALKALYYSRFTNELVFADDSGLEVDGLGGAPGILSARFAAPNATDAQNNELLLAKIANISERSARFVTVIALARGAQLLTSCSAQVAGEILTAPRGANGFGYDPLFFYPPLNRSLAELTNPEKFAVSARGKALRLVLEWLSEASAKPVI